MKTGDYLQIILTLVAEEYEESVDDIRSSSRRMELVRCRTMYCAVAWQLLHPALRHIAEPINRCIPSIHFMILNHLKIDDNLYIATHDKVKKKALQAFKNFSKTF